MSLNLLLKVIYVSILCSAVQGTLTPDGTVSLDCGSQQTFTCSVTDGVLWTISGLSGASVEGNIGLFAAIKSSRITTTDTSIATTSSTITITGFTTADNGGTVQCINQMGANISFQGTANISVGPPSCSANVTSVRIDNFTSTTVTWQQPPNTPPVTFTTVTYCPTSSPNCGESMNCTSPCTISGLDPCLNYSIILTVTNNCGSFTGCTGSMVAAKGIPSCPTDVNLDSSTLRNNDCDVSLTWQQPANTPPVTSTTVTYCPTSSLNCRNSVSLTCTSPCTISGLLNDTEYLFTVITNNNCGSPTGCTGNSATHNVLFHSESCSSCTTPSTGICLKSTLQPSPAVEAPLLAAIIPTVVLLLVNIITGVVVFLITRHCYKKTSQKSSPSKGEDVYEQVEGPKTYEGIVMTDSPAYGPVK